MSPIDLSLYPHDWREISRRIRLDRAGGRCECEGQCGLHRTTPGPRRCTEKNGQPAAYAKEISGPAPGATREK